MTKYITLFFFAVLLVPVPATWAQSGVATYNIVAGQHKFTATGSVLSISITDLFGDAIITSMDMDGELFGSKISLEDAIELFTIYPPEQHVDGGLNTATTVKRRTYGNDDTYVEITIETDDTSGTLKRLKTVTIKKDEDGTDTITVIYETSPVPGQPPIIRTDP